MGRIGVSEFQVFQAADQLAADGLQPSVDTVRVELGNTGSRTTINKYLKTWRERRAHRDAAGANLGGHLKQVISEQAELLLSALEAESSAKLQTKTQEFEAAIQTLKENYYHLEQTHVEAIKTLKSVQELADNQAMQLLQKQSEFIDMRDQIQTEREALAKEVGRRETLERAIVERDHQLAAIQKQLKISQSRNEALSESLATKNSELHQLQQKERDQRAQLKEKSDEIKRLNRDLSNVRARSDKELTRLTQAVTKLVPQVKKPRSSRAK